MSEKTYEECIENVKNSVGFLRASKHKHIFHNSLLSVPDDVKNNAEFWRDLLKKAVERDGLVDDICVKGVMKAVPKELKKAVKDATCWVTWLKPKETVTPKMCLEAVKKYYNAIMDVPEKLRTKEICLIALSYLAERNYSGDKNKILDCVPSEFWKDESFCLDAVKSYCNAIQYVLKNNPDSKPKNIEDICIAAVEQDWRTIIKIPDELKTLKICIAAITLYDMEKLLKYVPEAWKEQVKEAALLKRAEG